MLRGSAGLFSGGHFLGFSSEAVAVAFEDYDFGVVDLVAVPLSGCHRQPLTMDPLPVRMVRARQAASTGQNDSMPAGGSAGVAGCLDGYPP